MTVPILKSLHPSANLYRIIWTIWVRLSASEASVHYRRNVTEAAPARRPRQPRGRQHPQAEDCDQYGDLGNLDDEWDDNGDIPEIDNDDDNNGIPELQDNFDNDGIINNYDFDNDGIINSIDDDDDNDGE